MDLLSIEGIDVIASYPVWRLERFRQVVSRVIEEGHRLVVVGGGDETFNTISDLFVHQDTVLGILPMGIANNFTRTMGIPLSLEKAVDVIAHGKVVDVDLGMINGQYFINIATIGFSRDVMSAQLRDV